MSDYSPEFLKLLKSITAKRPRTVIEHILKNGFITTQELKDLYGYNHPPRAVRDVRENGIPIETFRVAGSDGRKIAAYRFGIFNVEAIKKLSGRTVLSKKIKEELLSRYGSKCFIYNETMDERDLQIDHRVPYEVGGDPDGEFDPDDFMLLCASANRAKSWSCENCSNWNNEKYTKICLTCYWAYPENYSHIALNPIRRVDLMWQGKEVATYEELKRQSNQAKKEIQQTIKDIIEKNIKN